MANDLQTKLDAILLDKNTNLLPENLKKDVTCLGITGTYEGSGGTVEGIKQFSTVEEMQADTTAKDGDLAVVLNTTYKTFADFPLMRSVYCPETIVLDEAIDISNSRNLQYSGGDYDAGISPGDYASGVVAGEPEVYPD